jgi:glucosamine-6-phosphate deaminase
MEVIVLKSTEEVAATAAQLLGVLLRSKPGAVLGLATGSTPLALYRALVADFLEGKISFKKITSFNLDEYLGVDSNNPQSYRSYMDRELFDQVDINKTRTFLPACADHENPRVVGALYEKQIQAAGGIDLQVLGIGANGHIGFNEPSSSLKSRTRVKTLTRQTLKDNSRLFAETEFQPKLAMTMGIATIMDARKILLLATGSNKSAAMAKMIEGPVTAMCPASMLQMHEHTTVLLDEQAAGELQNRQYYDWANEQNEALHDRFGEFNAT